MIDDYMHTDSNLIYIVDNILGPTEQSVEYEHLANDFYSLLTQHCSCDEICLLPECKCLLKSHNENYSTIPKNKYKHDSLNTMKKSYPIFECSEYCLCSNDCNNRVVQKGPIHCLEIKPCNKGLGLFTTRFIQNGTFICTYAGELITKSQANARYKINLSYGKMNYIFCLKEHCNGCVIETFVDPSIFGNIGRYMNHSCEPNCHIVPVRYDCPIPKLAIFAMCDVLPGNELTFHYGCDESDLQFTNRIMCLCGSKKCSGFLPFYE